MSKEIVTTAANAFATVAPSHVNVNSTRGQENVGTDDISLPRLDVAQDISKQIKRKDPAYIQGAEAGDLFNTVTNDLYGSSVYFVPVYFKKEFLIWKKQNAGGGFKGSFPTADLAAREFASQGYESVDHEVVPTSVHFGIVVHIAQDGEMTTEQLVISMSKSKNKASRMLNTLCRIQGGDRFSQTYEVSSILDRNAQGQEYWNLAFKRLGYTPKAVYMEAEAMYKSVSAGEAKAAHGETEKPQPNRSSNGDTTQTQEEEDDFMGDY